MGRTSTKGEFGVSMILAEVVRRGHKVALPLGDDWPFDLIVYRQGRLERVQCKYTESDGKVIKAKCRSASAWVNYNYTLATVDWVAVYDRTTDRCYFIPADELGTEGQTEMNLRLTPPKNNQVRGIRMASDYLTF